MARRRLVLVVLLVSRIAGAEPEIPWDLGYSYGGGVTEFGDRTFGHTMLQARLGYAVVPPVSVAVTGEMINLDKTIEGHELVGVAVRGLVGLDWELGHDPTTDFPMTAHLLGGTGIEFNTWDRGTVTRPVFYAGAEFVEGFLIRSDGAFIGIRRLAARIGMRLQASPGIEQRALARVCTECGALPMTSAPLDLGIVGYMGLAFGR